MTIYSREELEEFHKLKVKELQEKLEENEERFTHILPRNSTTTSMDEQQYIKKMLYDMEEATKRKRLGKKHTAYSPEFGLEIL